MVLARRPTSWSALARYRSAAVPIRSTFSRQSWHLIQRRGYASGGDHSSSKAGGDLPWLIGSIAVTVPTCYYLAQQTPTADHGHSEHGDEHGGEHEGGEHEGEASEEETADSEKPEESIEEVKDDTSDENEESSDEKQDDKSDDSGDEGEKQQDTPDTSDDEESGNTAHEVGGGGNVEGVRFKGATKGGTKDGEQGDTRKHIPDAKGYNKKRIESDYGMKQGEVAEEPHVGDKPAASKPPGGMQSQSGKQEGLSNTDTKHSTDITNNPEKSRKGEGTPETSKSKGTVDPKRPQAEARE